MPFFLYLCFTISFFLHLTARIPPLGHVRFDMLLMIITSMATLFGHSGAFRLGDSKPARALFLFVIYVIVETPFVQYPGSVIHSGLENYAKVVPFFFFTVYLVDTKKKLKIFMGVFLLCQMFRTLEPLYLHMTEGYWGSAAYSVSGGALAKLDRLSSGPKDVLNPTQFGWLIISHMVFVYYLLWTGGKIRKLIFISYSLLAILTFLLTGARSGLICLVLVVLQMIWFTENRKRAVVLVILFTIPVTIFAGVKMGPALKTRYLSLVKSDVAGSDTASGRVNGLKKNLSSVLGHPLLGSGLGTTREANANTLGSTQPTHNMYLEVMQETGLIGFVVFMIYIKALLSELHATRKRLLPFHPQSFVFLLSTALIVWMQMHLVYVLSCFSLNRWEWYLTGGLTVVCVRLAGIHANDPDSLKGNEVFNTPNA